jgi:hypothetical protein
LGFNKNIKIVDLKSKIHHLNDKIIYYHKKIFENIYIISPYSLDIQIQKPLQFVKKVGYHFSTETFPKCMDDLYLKIQRVK